MITKKLFLLIIPFGLCCKFAFAQTKSPIAEFRESLGYFVYKPEPGYASSNTILNRPGCFVIDPYWEVTQRKLFGSPTVNKEQVKDEEFAEWLAKYSKLMGKDQFFVQKNPFNSGYLIYVGLVSKPYEPARLLEWVKRDNDNYTGIELVKHKKIFEENVKNISFYYSDLLRKRYYLSEVKKGIHISPDNPIKFEKAYSPFILSDSVLNGKVILSFFRSQTDLIPSFYYNGIMKNGLFDSLGLLIEIDPATRKIINSKRGLFSNGNYLPNNQLITTIDNNLKNGFLKTEMGLTSVDSFKYEYEYMNLFPERSSSFLVYHVTIKVEAYSSGKKNWAYVICKNEESNTIAPRFEILFGDDDTKIYATKKQKEIADSIKKAEAAIARKEEEENTKIYNETGGGEKYDELTAIKKSGVRTIVNDCQKDYYPNVQEISITIFTRKAIGKEWKNIGTWKLVAYKNCGGFYSYGVNLINKDKKYMNETALDVILDGVFNSTSLNFEKSYIRQSDAESAIIDYAIRHRPLNQD